MKKDIEKAINEIADFNLQPSYNLVEGNIRFMCPARVDKDGDLVWPQSVQKKIEALEEAIDQAGGFVA